LRRHLSSLVLNGGCIGPQCHKSAITPHSSAHNQARFGDNWSMFYHMRIYNAVPENLVVFHSFFRTHLLPVQLRHGARLVGRWETEDTRVVAIWEYDDRASYERIEAAVHQDPDSRRAQQHRATLPPIINAQEETFMYDAVVEQARE